MSASCPACPRAARVARGCAALAALLVLGCTPGSDGVDGQVAERGAAAVAAVDDVATAQRTVDGALGEALTVLRRGDETVRRLRAPASAAAARDDLPDVRDQVAALRTADLTGPLDELEAATRRARAAVAAAATAAADVDDAWLQEYLAAEALVLDAVAAHAEAGGELREVVDDHRSALQDTLDAALALDVDGDGQELAAAVELQLGDELESLIAAQERTVEATEARAETAQALNATSADAAAVAERRPAP